jgi:tol-pal system protein YbgF
MKRALRNSLMAAMAAAFSIAPLAAQAQFFSDDEARRAILQLRERVNTMQNEINAKVDKTSTLDLHNENQALRQEIARLRGQIEVLTNELANTQKRQKDFYVDLDNRLRQLEPRKITVDGREVTVEQAEQRAYEAALAHFREGDYRNAAAAFYDFVRRYPQSGLAASAQYWLGNTYYALRDYQNAIAAHRVVLEKYPTDSRAPEALLNIASCHIELKDRVAAREALEALVARYPDAPAASTARERLTALRQQG